MGIKNFLYIFAKMTEEKERIVGYWLLYKFLKENGILNDYLANEVRANKPKLTAKNMLMSQVCNYIKQSYGGTNRQTFVNLYNFGPTSFFWDQSIEGREFWLGYFSKWEKFFKNNKDKFEKIYGK